jgi:hypothetical protein
MRRRRSARGWLIAVALAVVGAGCGTTAPTPTPRGPVKATTGNGFEAQTLYQCTPSSGNQVLFAQPKWSVSVMVRTGVIWVRPHSGLDTAGTTPTSPIPTANTVADGWVRLGDGQTVSWGIEDQTLGFEGNRMVYDQLASLDVWCELQGDLVVVAH